MYKDVCVHRELLIYEEYPGMQLHNDIYQYLFAPKHMFVVLREIIS